MDPLSDVLSLLKPRSYTFGGFDAGGAFSMQFPAHEGIKCYAVVSGQGWLSVEGVPDPVHLTAGDCSLLPSGRPFRFSSDLALTPTDVPETLWEPWRNGGIVTINGGGDCSIVGGHFLLSGANADVLLGSLPPIVHIRKESDKAAMSWSLERMMHELREPLPGGFLLAENLAYLMLVQALRLHLAEGLKGGVGWLFALADKQVSRAISAMHDNPARRWTLQELAEQAGMSRSPFAQRFKETVGISAMEYLTSWRMMLAAERLKSSNDTISEISAVLGYESESAFSAAFKRVKGCSPRQYGRGRKRGYSVVAETETFHATKRLETAKDFF
jgi:AraC-like DNA-binding protein